MLVGRESGGWAKRWARLVELWDLVVSPFFKDIYERSDFVCCEAVSVEAKGPCWVCDANTTPDCPAESGMPPP